MALSAVIGHAQSLDARQAGAQAARKATDELERSSVILAIVIASHHLPLAQVVSGAANLIGDAPVWGFSTSGEITNQGMHTHSVIVALLTGSEVEARAHWQAGFGADSRDTTQRLLQALAIKEAGALLLAVEGLNGETQDLCAALPEGSYTLAGCLAGGDFTKIHTSQAGGAQSGENGLAGVFISGNIRTGIGLAHGWQPSGRYAQVSKAQENRVILLDEKPAVETYASLLGYSVQEWTLPPLNELVRLYPIGIEISPDQPLLVRSPLRVNPDGSLRMHTRVPTGSVGQILVGSSDLCLLAARQAAETARQQLGEASPALALVLVDTAWSQLLQTHPGRVIQAVQDVLGATVPIAGGYTFGQIARWPANDQINGRPELYQQHLAVILFG